MNQRITALERAFQLARSGQIDADAPLTVRQCWCRVRQYLGAGSGVVSAGFLKDAVNVSGPLTDYVSCADSGSVMHRRFCPQCGTQVFSEAEPRPQMAQSTVSRLFRAGTRQTRIAMKPPVPATTDSLQGLAATTPHARPMRGTKPRSRSRGDIAVIPSQAAIEYGPFGKIGAGGGADLDRVSWPC
jgi:hypothetical protein